jgi:hypothetical protein
VPMRRHGAQGLRVGNSFHSFEPGFEQRIRLCLNPTGDDAVRRPAARRIVLPPGLRRNGDRCP